MVFFTSECQSGSGGFFSSAVFNCINRKNPEALAQLVQYCAAFAAGGTIAGMRPRP